MVFKHVIVLCVVLISPDHFYHCVDSFFRFLIWLRTGIGFWTYSFEGKAMCGKLPLFLSLSRPHPLFFVFFFFLRSHYCVISFPDNLGFWSLLLIVQQFQKSNDSKLQLVNFKELRQPKFDTL